MLALHTTKQKIPPATPPPAHKKSQPIAAADLNPHREAGDTVYEATRELVDWPAVAPRGGALGVTAQVWSCANVANSQLVARRVRDAALDAVRDATCAWQSWEGGGEGGQGGIGVCDVMQRMLCLASMTLEHAPSRRQQKPLTKQRRAPAATRRARAAAAAARGPDPRPADLVPRLWRRVAAPARCAAAAAAACF
jgi:hypothetical protein